jgi:hypothetical protein
MVTVQSGFEPATLPSLAHELTNCSNRAHLFECQVLIKPSEHNLECSGLIQKCTSQKWFKLTTSLLILQQDSPRITCSLGVSPDCLWICGWDDPLMQQLERRSPAGVLHHLANMQARGNPWIWRNTGKMSVAEKDSRLSGSHNLLKA